MICFAYDFEHQDYRMTKYQDFLNLYRLTLIQQFNKMTKRNIVVKKNCEYFRPFLYILFDFILKLQHFVSRQMYICCNSSFFRYSSYNIVAHKQYLWRFLLERIFIWDNLKSIELNSSQQIRTTSEHMKRARQSSIKRLQGCIEM